MFSRYYRIHVVSLALGGIVSFLVSLHSFPWNLQIPLRVFSIICLAVTMIFYYKIISVLNKVSNITNTEMWIAIVAHLMTLFAIACVGVQMVAASAVFLGSVVLRNWAGITEIDAQMKSLCMQLDLELYRIGEEMNLDE